MQSMPKLSKSFRSSKKGVNGPISIRPQECIACGHCVAICPNSALDHIKSPLTEQTVLNTFPVLNSDIAEQFIRSRRSIRCFKNQKVPREQLMILNY